MCMLASVFVYVCITMSEVCMLCKCSWATSMCAEVCLCECDYLKQALGVVSWGT